MLKNPYQRFREKVSEVQKQPPDVLRKKGVLRNVAKFTRKHLCQSLLLIKLQAWSLQLYIKKEILVQVFSCEFCQISKNTFCTDYLWTTASRSYAKNSAFLKICFITVKTWGFCLSRIFSLFRIFPPGLRAFENLKYWKIFIICKTLKIESLYLLSVSFLTFLTKILYSQDACSFTVTVSIFLLLLV